MDIIIPDLGEVGEVKLVRWLVAPGEAVVTGDPVAEVEADKAVFVVEAPSAGVLERTLIAQGQTTRPGEAIARLIGS